MERRKTNPAEVALAILAQLRAQLIDANEANCFLALEPNPTVPNVGGWFCVVEFAGGQFDEGVLDGAGREAVRQTNTITITTYSLAALDQAGQHGTFLTNDTAGVFRKWREVLDALTLFDPVAEDGKGLLCEPMFPTDYGPVIARKPTRAGWTQNFRITFEWDLTV